MKSSYTSLRTFYDCFYRRTANSSMSDPITILIGPDSIDPNRPKFQGSKAKVRRGGRGLGY